jgi:hypothetical protein
MIRKRLVSVTPIAGCAFLILTGQAAEPPAPFTAARAEAGRAVFHSKPLESFGGRLCAECYGETLLGKDGTGEVPEWRLNFGSVVVPPLAGADFMKKWGAKTTKDLYTRIQLVTHMDEKTYLDIVAYNLQANGARPGTQPLTAATVVEVRSIATPVASR